MKRIVLTLVLGVATLGLTPTTARAQFYGGPVNPIGNPIRVAQRQVVSWYQAYLGRLPNARELSILSNILLTGNSSMYVQSLILSSNEFYLKAGNNGYGFINSLFFVTLGRQATIHERALLSPQLNIYGRLWFTQAFLAQAYGGGLANLAALQQLQAAVWGYPTRVVPVIW